jgi:hypothetical protein
MLAHAIGSPSHVAIEVASIHAELAYLEQKLRAPQAATLALDAAIDALRPFARDPAIRRRIESYEAFRPVVRSDAQIRPDT